MRVPRIVVPVLVLLAAAIGTGAARFLVAPSFAKEYRGGERNDGTETVALVVDGLRCVDTARRVASQLDDLPGVRRCVTFAARNRAEVTFDPALVDAESIREAIEGPVYDAESQTFLYNQFRVLEMNGIEPDSARSKKKER